MTIVYNSLAKINRGMTLTRIATTAIGTGLLMSVIILQPLNVSQIYLVAAIIALLMIAVITWSLKNPAPPAASADPSTKMSLSWDAEKITVVDEGKVEHFPWRLVGRIDRYAYHDHKTAAYTLTTSLLVQVYRDSDLREYIFNPASIAASDLTVDDLIHELNDLHSKAIEAHA